MRRIILILAICAIFVTPVFAKDPNNTVYIVNFGESDVGTAADGTKTFINLKVEAARVVKIWGGLMQDESSTSYDLTFYSDNIAATEQEDVLYHVDNITDGYINDDTPVFLGSTGDTVNGVYYKIHNDGAEANFDFNIMYEPYYKKP